MKYEWQWHQLKLESLSCSCLINEKKYRGIFMHIYFIVYPFAWQKKRRQVKKITDKKKQKKEGRLRCWKKKAEIRWALICKWQHNKRDKMVRGSFGTNLGQTKWDKQDFAFGYCPLAHKGTWVQWCLHLNDTYCHWNSFSGGPNLKLYTLSSIYTSIVTFQTIITGLQWIHHNYQKT